MSIARPQAVLLRAPLRNELKKHVIVATGISVVIALAYKFLINDQRKRDYANFHRTYDEKRHFNRMVQAGVFQSVKPNAETPKWVQDYEKEVDQAIAALRK